MLLACRPRRKGSGAVERAVERSGQETRDQGRRVDRELWGTAGQRGESGKWKVGGNTACPPVRVLIRQGQSIHCRRARRTAEHTDTTQAKQHDPSLTVRAFPLFWARSQSSVRAHSSVSLARLRPCACHSTVNTALPRLEQADCERGWKAAGARGARGSVAGAGGVEGVAGVARVPSTRGLACRCSSMSMCWTATCTSAGMPTHAMLSTVQCTAVLYSEACHTRRARETRAENHSHAREADAETRWPSLLLTRACETDFVVFSFFVVCSANRARARAWASSGRFNKGRPYVDVR